jgi:glycosyltransferase involved in cell wall biosynthesis
MRILCLPAWYPTKITPFNGDFLQRHIKAISLFNGVQVIHVLRDSEGAITKNVKIEEISSENVSEKIIYYYSPQFSPGIMDRFFSGWKYIKLYKQAIRDYMQQYGEPDLVHVHIAPKVGMIARWVKKKWNIPYVVSEQWGGYLPESENKFSRQPFYFKAHWRKVMKNAAALSVVSFYLGQSIQRILRGTKFIVIPNVVDTTIFNPVVFEKKDITRFIHISLLNYQKNVEDILKALAILKEETPNFCLTIVGPQKDNLKRLVNELQIESEVEFHHEIPQSELAKLVQKSDALILYSRYETFGCVIIEALACGKPVILSDLPVMHENAKEYVNAVFAKGENPPELAKKLSWFICHRENFKADDIAKQAASTYNYEKVGRQFNEWYQKVIQSIN